MTAADVLGARNHGLSRNDWPVLAYDKVRYVGDAVALVAAETEEIAEAALKLIEVDYEPLPVVASAEASLAEDAPSIHEEGNVLKHLAFQRGDVEAAFAQAAQVEVDITTGEVKVLKVIAAHDVGRAINPMAVAGQLEGGVMMGLGYALTEEFKVEEGRVLSDSFVKYQVPRIRQLPEIVPIIVEHETVDGPYGAKGVGEITSIPTTAAITNAIYAACGARIFSLPATPGKILAALGRGSV